MSTARRAVAVALGIGAVIALASAAWAAPPKAGDYQGCPNSAHTTAGHCEGEGYFSLAGGKIKRYGAFAGILAPSDFVCNQLNAVLETKSIPVTGGKFDYRGTAKIGYGASPSGPFKRMDVHFKGTWKSASLVEGFTRISGKNGRGPCDSGKINWEDEDASAMTRSPQTTRLA